MTGPDAPVCIDRFRRTVADLARSIDFYRGALGFELTRGDARSVRLQLGQQHIELLQHADLMPLPPGAIAPDPRLQHAAIVTCDMESAWRRVEAHGAVAISRHGPQVLPANTGGVTAFKFRDLDGHPLELIRFPAGVGDPRWQGVAADGSTLGIDHFALVVADVHRSTAIMAQRLGFWVLDRGVNFGPEQDRLDAQAQPGIGTPGHKPSFASFARFRAHRAVEWQVSGDPSRRRGGLLKAASGRFGAGCPTWRRRALRSSSDFRRAVNVARGCGRRAGATAGA